MKVYEVRIKPLSGFGTPPKGDTLFGTICWQIQHGAYEGLSLEEILSDYEHNPFIVISSFLLAKDNTYIFKRPSLPIYMLFPQQGTRCEMIMKRKEIKNKRWLVLKKGERIHSLCDSSLYKSDFELNEDSSLSQYFEQPRNTINRIWSTTGDAPFSPYTVEQIVYNPNIYLICFIGIRDDIDIGKIISMLERIGDFGFGKDATVGLGRFKVVQWESIDLRSLGSENPNALYTLAPFVPEENFQEIYFNPFIRFGKHGDILAKASNPFKNPVIMADEGAVCMISDERVLKKHYIGKALKGLSKVQSYAVCQGYSLYIPVRVEE